MTTARFPRRHWRQREPARGRRPVPVAVLTVGSGTAVALSGSAPSASEISGDLELSVALSGSAPSASEISGDLELSVSLSGSAPSASEVSGDLTIEGVVTLSGSAPSASEISGDLELSVALSGSAPSASGVTGDLVIDGAVALSGSAPSASGITGELILAVDLSGSAPSASEITGDLSVENNGVALSGSTPSASGASGAVSLAYSLSGSGSAASGASGVLSGGSSPDFIQWQLRDPVTLDTYNFERNPSSGNPTLSKNMVYQSYSPGKTVAYKRASTAETVRVSGVLTSADQLGALTEWSQKRYPVTLEDDLGRKYTIYIQSFRPTRRRKADTDYYHDYILTYVLV